MSPALPRPLLTSITLPYAHWQRIAIALDEAIANDEDENPEDDSVRKIWKWELQAIEQACQLRAEKDELPMVVEFPYPNEGDPLFGPGEL